MATKRPSQEIQQEDEKTVEVLGMTRSQLADYTKAIFAPKKHKITKILSQVEKLDSDNIHDQRCALMHYRELTSQGL